MSIIDNIVGSYKHIPYTWKHYLAFMKVQKQLLGYYRIKFHDWDKLLMFIFLPFLGERIINQWHQKHNKHHPTYTTGKNWDRNLKDPYKVDWIEAIIDWECARFTKPDKPLNAQDTCLKYYLEYYEVVKPYLKKLRLLDKNE